MRPDSEEYLQHLDTSIKEMGRNGLQEEVTNGFKRHYELVYHTHDSRNSPKGFPDTIVAPLPHEVFVAGGPRLIVIELKVGNRKLEPEQIRWLQGFRAAGAFTFAFWPRHRKVLERLYQGDFSHHLVQERLHVYTKRGG